MQELRHALSDADQQVIQTLVDERIAVACYLVPIDDTTWAIRGSIAVDGDGIVAEFTDFADAQSALEQLAAAGLGPEPFEGSSP